MIVDVISEALGPGSGPGADRQDYYFFRRGEEDRQKDYYSPRHCLSLGLGPPPGVPKFGLPSVQGGTTCAGVGYLENVSNIRAGGPRTLVVPRIPDPNLPPPCLPPPCGCW